MRPLTRPPARKTRQQSGNKEQTDLARNHPDTPAPASCAAQPMQVSLRLHAVLSGAEIFCAIRSYLATADRHDIDALTAHE